MQGNCNSEAEFGTVPLKHAPLRRLLPRQCLILANHNVLEVWDSQLWLDSLYFRLTNPQKGSFDQFVIVKGPIAEVWMTSVTLQGNGDFVQDCVDCGFTVLNGGKLFAGGTFPAHIHQKSQI
jgi:hypothetical protein